MPKSIFSEAGIAGVGFLLIVVGIVLTQIEGMLGWAKFSISLGGCVIFFLLASKVKNATVQVILNIIGLVALVAAIIFFVNAV